MEFIRSLFNAEGRMPRSKYWVFFGAFILGIVADVLVISVYEDAATGLICLIVFYLLLSFILWIVAAIKRCHDRNHSGFYLFLYFVPFANLWMLFELAALRGTRGENTYGPDPLIPVSEPAPAVTAPLKTTTPVVPTIAAGQTHNIMKCNKCGGPMRVETEGVFYFGEGSSPTTKLRCDHCDITRFEKRKDVEAALTEEKRSVVKKETDIQSERSTGGSPITRTFSQILVMIFREDDLIRFENTTRYIDSSAVNRPEDSLPPGEYTVVYCGIDFIGNQLAVTNVDVKQTRFEIPLYYGYLIKLYERYSFYKRAPEEVTVIELTTANLSKVQCEKIITQIKSEGSWLWDYADPPTKKSLQQAYSKEDEAFGLALQGAALMEKKQFHEAIALLQSAVELHPKIGGVRVNLGRAALEIGQVEDAISWFEKELSLAADPHVLNANLYLAAIYDAKGDWIKTQMHLEAVKSTEEYQRNPISLDPAVVRKIRMAVSKQA